MEQQKPSSESDAIQTADARTIKHRVAYRSKEQILSPRPGLKISSQQELNTRASGKTRTASKPSCKRVSSLKKIAKHLKLQGAPYKNSQIGFRDRSRVAGYQGNYLIIYYTYFMHLYVHIYTHVHARTHTHIHLHTTLGRLYLHVARLQEADRGKLTVIIQCYASSATCGGQEENKISPADQKPNLRRRSRSFVDFEVDERRSSRALQGSRNHDTVTNASSSYTPFIIYFSLLQKSLNFCLYLSICVNFIRFQNS